MLYQKFVVLHGPSPTADTHILTKHNTNIKTLHEWPKMHSWMWSSSILPTLAGPDGPSHVFSIKLFFQYQNWSFFNTLTFWSTGPRLLHFVDKMQIIALPLLLVPFLLEESDRLSAEQPYDSNVGFLSTHERVVAADEIRTKTILTRLLSWSVRNDSSIGFS